MIEVNHLIHARGNVRCNLCGTVFDGLETLSAEKPHEDEDLLLHDFDNAPPLLTQAYQSSQVFDSLEDDHHDHDDTEDIDFQEPVSASSESETIPEFITHQDSVADVPFVAEKRKQQQPKESRLLWSGLSVFMLLGLLWQAQLSLASGQVKLPEHAFSEKLCQIINCLQQTEEVDLNSISLVSRNIRPHPGRDQALIISASMINANKDNQKFPALEIKLSDLNGQIVAMRRFVAEEYVPSDVLRAGFVANTLIPINLEIASPGADAVAFEIGFVQP